jgi:hypothetical protein
MTRITIIVAAAAVAALASSPVFSQSSENAQSDNAMGTTGENGGSTQTSPLGDGASTKYYQPPVATGLDLKGPAKTEGPFAE